MISLLLLASLVTVRLPSHPICKPREAPCITITLSVQPEKNNHEVVVQLFADDLLYRESTLDMTPFCEVAEGKEVCKYPPHSLQITYPKVPSGEYVIRATLFKHEGKTWQAGVDEKKIIIQ